MPPTRKPAGEPSPDAIYQAYYMLAVCSSTNGNPYHLLSAHATSGSLVKYDLLMDALLNRLPNYRPQPSRMGDRNWDRGLPELLTSCPTLLPRHLTRIDEAAVRNPAILWMRQFVAEYPNADFDVLEMMTTRGGGVGTDGPLALVVRERLARFEAARALAAYRTDRRARAQQRLYDYLESVDRAAFALLRFRNGDIDVEEALELAGVGPSFGDIGLVGGGKGASEPDDGEFTPEQLPTSGRGRPSKKRLEALEEGAEPTERELEIWRTHRAKEALHDELADQFDFWKIESTRGSVKYAVSWRDSEGLPSEYDGLYDSVPELHAAVKAAYAAVDFWTDR